MGPAFQPVNDRLESLFRFPGRAETVRERFLAATPATLPHGWVSVDTPSGWDAEIGGEYPIGIGGMRSQPRWLARQRWQGEAC